MHARRLAELLSANLLTEVALPTEEQEAARDLVRAREDVKSDQTKARHRLGKWLLRRGFRYATGKRAWTDAHTRWLGSLQFEHKADEITFKLYFEQLKRLGEILDQLDDEIAKLAQTDDYRILVGRLRCFHGIDTLTAITLATERLRRKSPLSSKISRW